MTRMSHDGVPHPAALLDRCSSVGSLAEFIERHPRLFVLTGAGCSTESGIPDYRDADGEWKRSRPIMLQDFLANERSRQRYWARSLVGFRRLGGARPNDAHRSLARLERRGRIAQLVTQNVDGLHQAAGSRDVIDLHGRIDTVRCLTCGARIAREQLQMELVTRNPAFAAFDALEAPDGDADLDGVAFDAFDVPACDACGGLLKPDVVFFGENVPGERVRRAMAALDVSDAMLVVGSSLMVYSDCRRQYRPHPGRRPPRTQGGRPLRERLVVPARGRRFRAANGDGDVIDSRRELRG
jgi:NAD-dependent SIR2 family protein deacetylase